MTDNAIPSRRDVKRQRRRTQILAVGQRFFLSRGYAGTSMSAIAAELGGSKGTLWSHFRSKEELFGAVLDIATAAYRQHLSDLLQPSVEIRATLICFCESYIERLHSQDALRLIRLIAGEVERFPEAGEIFCERLPQATENRLAEFFRDRLKNNEIGSGNPHYMAGLLMQLCWGQFYTRFFLNDENSARQVVDAERLVDFFLRGLDII